MVKKLFGTTFALLLVFSLFSCAYMPKEPMPSESGITTAPPVTLPLPQTEPQVPQTEPAETEASEKKSINIMIDAGHGEIDPGAVVTYSGVTYEEKDINLAVALFLRDELVARGYTVFLIREDDTSLLHGGNNIDEIVARRELAIEKQTDFYISLHCNSFVGSGRAYGPIIFYREKVDYDALSFAETMKEAIIEGMKDYPDTRECRVKRDDDYAVLKIESMPTLLFEMGFMTDESDAKQLFDTEWQKAVAKSISDGIDAFYEKNYFD